MQHFSFLFNTWCISKTLRLAFFPLAIAEIKLHLNCCCNGFVMVWRNFKYDVCLYETKFYVSNVNGTALNYRKTKTLIAKLKQTNILKLVNIKFVYIT